MTGNPVAATRSRSRRDALGPRIDDAAAGIEDRPLSSGHHRHCLSIFLGIAFKTGMIGLMLDVLRAKYSPRANCTSFGISMTTGPGRPC